MLKLADQSVHGGIGDARAVVQDLPAPAALSVCGGAQLFEHVYTAMVPKSTADASSESTSRWLMICGKT